jgi:hypothetical protein
MDNHAFLVRYLLCNAGHSVDLLPCIFLGGKRLVIKDIGYIFDAV